MYTWDVPQRQCENKQRYCWKLHNHVWIQNFRGRRTENLPYSENFRVSPWSYDIEGHVKKCVWNDSVSWRTKRLNNSAEYQLHASIITTSKKKNWNRWENCQKYALKLFWNAYAWHVLDALISYGQWTSLHDRLRNEPKLVTNDYLVWSLIFITHVITNSIVMWETLPNKADWDCFKTPILQEISRIQNRHQVEHCAFSEAIRLCQSVGCVKNKFQFRTVQEKSEIISMDAGFRLDRIPALDWWDLIVAVLHGNTYQSNQERGHPYKSPTRKKLHGKIGDLDNVEFIFSNVHSSREEALLYLFEDNEAVIKMIIKGRSPTMRHVSRTHRVALDWLFDRINWDHQDPNQIHWHQKPTRRHIDKLKFHTWWMESSFVFVYNQPFEFHQ